MTSRSRRVSGAEHRRALDILAATEAGSFGPVVAARALLDASDFDSALEQYTCCLKLLDSLFLRGRVENVRLCAAKLSVSREHQQVLLLSSVADWKRKQSGSDASSSAVLDFWRRQKELQRETAAASRGWRRVVNEHNEGRAGGRGGNSSSGGASERRNSTESTGSRRKSDIFGDDDAEPVLDGPTRAKLWLLLLNDKPSLPSAEEVRGMYVNLVVDGQDLPARDVASLHNDAEKCRVWEHVLPSEVESLLNVVCRSADVPYQSSMCGLAVPFTLVFRDMPPEYGVWAFARFWDRLGGIDPEALEATFERLLSTHDASLARHLHNLGVVAEMYSATLLYPFWVGLAWAPDVVLCFWDFYLMSGNGCAHLHLSCCCALLLSLRAMWFACDVSAKFFAQLQNMPAPDPLALLCRAGLYFKTLDSMSGTGAGGDYEIDPPTESEPATLDISGVVDEDFATVDVSLDDD